MDIGNLDLEYMWNQPTLSFPGFQRHKKLSSAFIIAKDLKNGFIAQSFKERFDFNGMF